MIIRASRILQVRLKRKKLWIHATKNLWKHVMVILVFINASKYLPLNVQTRVHSNIFYQGIIHEFYRRSVQVQIGIWRLVKSYCRLWRIKKRAENITLDTVSIYLQEKQSGFENNKKEDHQVNTYDKSKANRSTEENVSKKKKNASE